MNDRDRAVRDRLLSSDSGLRVPLRQLEWRESGSGDGSRIFTGYAAIYDSPTVLYESDTYRLVEVLERGAFTNVLRTRPDVHLVVGHDMNRAIARTNRTGMGSLKLTSDSKGLSVHAKLNPDDPDVRALDAKMSIGVVDEMSFAFDLRQKDQRFETVRTAGGILEERRTILNINKLYDVSVCSQGAYKATSANLRSTSIPTAVFVLKARAALIERTKL